MATLTEISKRATAHADKYEHNHRAHFTSYYSGATEQQEADIKAMQKWYCDQCGESCILASYCEDMEAIREAIEEG